MQAINENARQVLEHRTGNESNSHQEEDSTMTIPTINPKTTMVELVLEARRRGLQIGELIDEALGGSRITEEA